MLRRLLLVVVAIAAVLAMAGVVAYVGNAAPDVPPIAADADVTGSRPWVVKLHARWCPACMVTKDVWTDIEAAYAGRVNLLVLDFTNEATTAASEAEARRLGLTSVLQDYYGATGIVLVLDAGAGDVRAEIAGSRDLADYTVEIDAALAKQSRQRPPVGVTGAASNHVYRIITPLTSRPPRRTLDA